MDYEKKYKDALERARDVYTYYCDDREQLRKIESIFPELSESEDERIRKDIIAYIETANQILPQFQKDKWIAWLEKQCEQKHKSNIVPIFKVGDIIKNKKNGDTVKVEQILSDSYCYSGWDGAATIHSDFLISDQGNWELVEQKPADEKGMNLVEEEMTPFQKKVFCIIDTTIEEEQGLKQVCDELLRLAHDEIIQNTTWSEDELKVLNEIIEDYEKANKSFSGYQARIDWLKSLKDRVQPQPKQEWSEEDDKHLERILKELKNQWQRPYNRPYLDEIVSDYYWLKFLKYRYTWKPSDGQMRVLNLAVRCGINRGTTEETTLVSLFNDLKKLREE